MIRELMNKKLGVLGNVQFGLQHLSFSFDYTEGITSEIFDPLKNLIMAAEENGFDSFWVMDHFHQLQTIAI